MVTYDMTDVILTLTRSAKHPPVPLTLPASGVNAITKEAALATFTILCLGYMKWMISFASLIASTRTWATYERW